MGLKNDRTIKFLTTRPKGVLKGDSRQPKFNPIRANVMIALPKRPIFQRCTFAPPYFFGQL